MKALLLISLLTLDLYAADGCKIEVEKNQFQDVEALGKHLEWHGADNSQMQKAACKTLATPSLEEMRSFLNKFTSKTKGTASQNVYGVSLEKESPAMIDLFKKLTTAKDGFGFFEEKENQKNFQKEFSINPECKKVDCAVTKIWGEEQGIKMLYILAKHNFNTSEYAFSNSDRLKSDELDDILMAMEDLPKHLIPVGATNQRFTHFSRGYKLKNQSDRVAANAVVMLFDTWSNEPRFERQYSAFHEISHNIGSRLGRLDESPGWLKLSGWVKKGDDWSKGDKACFFTQYSMGNPFEDFAESLSTYRYNPKDFKKKCPEKYNFIKEKVFKGIEYTSNQTCSELPLQKLQDAADQLIPEIEKEIAKLTIDPALIKEKCQGTLTTYPVDETVAGECEAELIKGQLNKLDPEAMKAVLVKNGLTGDTNKMERAISALAETIQTRGLSPELSGQLRASVLKASDNYFNDIIQAALPKKTDKSDGLVGVRNLDFQLSTSCRVEHWKGEAAVKKCLSDYIIKDDKTWSQFGSKTLSNSMAFPEGMSKESKEALREKYYAELEKALLESDLLSAKVSAAKEEVRKQAKDYFKRTEYNFYKEKDWKKMEPADFCKKLYNTPDDYYRKYVFVSSSEEIPGFQTWCEQRQGEKKKRFQFSEDDLNEWLKQAL